MNIIRKLSIRSKIIFIILTINILSLIIGFSFVIINDITQLKDEMKEDIKKNATLVGQYCIVYLKFDDQKNAQDILAKLQTVQSIVYGQLFSATTTFNVTYNRTNEKHNLPKFGDVSESYFADGYLHHFEPIIHNNDKLGSIYVKVSTKELDAKIKNYILVMLLLSLCLIIISIALAYILEKLISKPILKLAEVTKEISQSADYSIRVAKVNNDEIGTLYDGFNLMLQQIEIHQKAISESEEKFKQMSESAFNAVFVMDGKGKILFWNHAAESMFGYKKDEITGNDLHHLFLPTNDFEQFIQRVFEFNKSGTGNQIGKSLEFSAMRKDQNEFPIEVSVASVLIKGEWNIVGTIKDITDRKNHELQLRKAKDDAEESDRLKSAFLANMSHEIRTPMNSIIGFSDLLKTTNVIPEKRIKYLDIISSNGKSLLNLIDDIIDVSKIEAGKLKVNLVECNINAIVSELFSSFEEKRKKQFLEFELRLAKPFPEQNLIIRTDPFRFRQIFANLLSNSLKFTEEGFIEFGYRIQDEKTLLFYCKDTGIGIPETKYNVIFERFGQIDSSFSKNTRGTGLGLNISKRLVELLGGGIWFESIEGEGSTFYFTLPYDKVVTPVKEIKIQGDAKYYWKDKRILVAEDEEDNYMLIEELLSETNATILRAVNGLEAVEICKANHIDIVLMDVNMPEMNGYDATRKIKQLDKKIRIIAQTAYAMSGERERSLQAGCDDYITKPLNVNELFATIDKHMR